MFDLLPYQEHFMLTCSRYHFPWLLDKRFSNFSSKIWIIALQLRSLLKVGRSKFITNEEILKNKPATILRKYWYLNVFEFYDALFFKWRKNNVCVLRHFYTDFNVFQMILLGQTIDRKSRKSASIKIQTLQAEHQ